MEATTNRSQLEQIILSSQFLRRGIEQYGWDASTRALIAEATARSIVQESDWRVTDIERLADRFGFDVRGDDRVLDAASGLGAVSLVAQRRGLNIAGIDLDDYSLDVARQLAERAGLSPPQIDGLFVQGSVTDLPFPDEHFAMMSSHQTIEHVDDRTEMLSELWRCLRPGGVLWLTAPDYRFCFEPHYRIPWYPMMPKRLAPVWLEVFDRPLGGLDTFDYTTLPACVGELEHAGFEILAAKTNTPESQIGEIHTRLFGEAMTDVPLEADRVRSFATRARDSGFTPEPVSLLVLCRKPDPGAEHNR